MTRTLLFALTGLSLFLLFDWLMFAFAYADIAWPISALDWPGPDAAVGRFFLYVFTVLGSVGSVVAGCSIANE